MKKDGQHNQDEAPKGPEEVKEEKSVGRTEVKDIGMDAAERFRTERTDEFGKTEELKLKQMKNSYTPSLSAERMREDQARFKTPYIVLSGNVKPSQTSALQSRFATVEKVGNLTPMLGDKKVTRLKTSYLVLGGNVKPSQTSAPQSRFATVENVVPGNITPMLGDKEVEHFLGIKRKLEPGNSNTPPKP